MSYGEVEIDLAPVFKVDLMFKRRIRRKYLDFLNMKFLAERHVVS